MEGPLEYAELHFIPITVKKSKQVYPSLKPIHILMQSVDSKKWKESIHPLFQERPQARDQKRPETQHNFANPGKEETRLQQYCNWNRQNGRQGSAGTVSSVIRR
jgi:hypothetical protein